MNLPSPPATGQFFSEGYAREHLCDHVLTRPEAHDWAVILPSYSSWVSPTNDAALAAVAASLFSSSPSVEGVELLKEYHKTLWQAIDDALRLGWWWEQRQGKYCEWFGLGLEGIHVIWDGRVIKTGFVPGSVCFPPGTLPPRTENPLPRRNPREKLRPPPPDPPRRHYELFRTSHHCVSNRYAKAYFNDEVSQAGGDIFVDPLATPRIGKWQHWRLNCPEEGRKNEAET